VTSQNLLALDTEKKKKNKLRTGRSFIQQRGEEGGHGKPSEQKKAASRMKLAI